LGGCSVGRAMEPRAQAPPPITLLKKKQTKHTNAHAPGAQNTHTLHARQSRWRIFRVHIECTWSMYRKYTECIQNVYRMLMTCV